MTVLKIENITFCYGEKPVFESFSLNLPDSGITAISGESGRGKTTLLRLIAGLEKPQSGTLEAPKPEDIAVMFQENRLLPCLDVTGQLEAVLPKNTDVAKYLEAVELEAEAHTAIDKLSGGMKRRVSLARCLAFAEVCNKKLILLDEPFTGIDSERVHRIMEFIRSLSIPVIYSAHDREALELADITISI
ncbi:MAG: ATP-binding cassette domain-containing protein [Oscillospiraceae bacterium]|nr:ATP-binding cassette domain-containing protein [Oscillospiraceae bacterium]